MRKFIILFLPLMLSALVLSAQVASSRGFEYRGMDFYQNGVKLENDALLQVLNEPACELYKQGKSERITGYVCTPVGVLSLFGGCVVIQQGLKIKSNPDYQIIGGNAVLGPLSIGMGAILIGAGVGCTVSGIVYLCRAHKTMLKVAEYQNRPGKEITLSPSQNGLGLALNF